MAVCPIVVGRDVERAGLEGLLVDIGRSAGGVWSLVGDAGLGKSRLVAEAIQSARKRGMRVLTGEASPTGESPFAPVTQALLTELADVEIPLSYSLRPFRAALGQLMPLWAQTDPADVESAPIILAEALSRLLAEVGGEHGCLLVVEDLHWASTELLELLALLAQLAAGRLAGARVGVLVTGRASSAPGWVELARQVGRAGHTWELHPLSEVQVREMLTGWFDVGEVPPELLAALKRFAGGVPFLIEELIEECVGAGHLRSGTGPFSPPGCCPRQCRPASLPMRAFDSPRSMRPIAEPGRRRARWSHGGARHAGPRARRCRARARRLTRSCGGGSSA